MGPSMICHVFFEPPLAIVVMMLLLQCLQSTNRGEIVTVGEHKYQFWNVAQDILIILVVVVLFHVNDQWPLVPLGGWNCLYLDWDWNLNCCRDAPCPTKRRPPHATVMTFDWSIDDSVTANLVVFLGMEDGRMLLSLAVLDIMKINQLLYYITKNLISGLNWSSPESYTML